MFKKKTQSSFKIILTHFDVFFQNHLKQHTHQKCFYSLSINSTFSFKNQDEKHKREKLSTMKRKTVSSCALCFRETYFMICLLKMQEKAESLAYVELLFDL